MQKQPIVLPILGQDFTVPSTLLNERSSYGQNIMVFEGDLRQKYGNYIYQTTSQTPMSEAVIHLVRYQQSDLTLKVVRLSSKKTQVYNDTSKDWDDITKSGVDWTGIEGLDFFDTAVFNGKLIITNGVDKIQKYTGSGLCTDLAGTPPVALYLESFKEYLVLAHVIDGGNTYPIRIQWCDTADETNWSTGNAGYLDIGDTNEKIIGIRQLNDLLVVFKENSIYTGKLVDTVDIFNFDVQVTEISVLNNRCIVNYNGILYFLSKDGNIYAFNGYTVQSIGEKIRSEIFNRFNANRLETCHARRNVQRKAIEFFITTGSNNWSTESWNINYEDGSIFYDTITNITTSCLFNDISGQETWDADTNSWDSDTTFWDEGLGGTGFSFSLLGKSDGYVYKEDSGALNDGSIAIDQQFITKDLSAEEHHNFKRWLKVQSWLKGNSVIVSYSTNYGANWTDIPYSTTQTKFDLTVNFAMYNHYLDTKSAYIRYRFRNNTLNESFWLRQIMAYFKVQENLEK